MDERHEKPTATPPAQPRVRYALDHIYARAHNPVSWRIEMTPEFEAWSRLLSERERAALHCDLRTLELAGPSLGRPYVDSVAGSRYSNMKELRTGTLRSFFVFDPFRRAVLLIGGEKRGDKRFYGRMIALADKLYDAHLDGIRRKDRNR
jgi:hypothetical protein